MTTGRINQVALPLGTADRRRSRGHPPTARHTAHTRHTSAFSRDKCYH